MKSREVWNPPCGWSCPEGRDGVFRIVIQPRYPLSRALLQGPQPAANGGALRVS